MTTMTSSRQSPGRAVAGVETPRGEGSPARATCRRWRAVSAGVYGVTRLVCTERRGHYSLHANKHSGWWWTTDLHERPRRRRQCNGRAEGEAEVCGTWRQDTFDGARAAGWRLRVAGGVVDAMCPRCARPDPSTVALCRDLERSVKR